MISSFRDRTVIAAALFLLIVAQGCQTDTQTKKKKPSPQVAVEPARDESISRSISLTGTIEPVRLAKVASAAQGPITALSVQEGDRVSVGASLLTIGRIEGAVAGLASAKEALQKEQEELGRVSRLVDSGAMAKDALDVAKARVESTRAKLVQAQERQRDYFVRAPWSGIVSRLFVREGFFVAPRAPLLEMFDDKSLVVRFFVPEDAAIQIRPDTPVSLTLDAYPKRKLKAQIVKIYPEIEPKTRTRTVEAKVSEEVELLRGMFARLELALETVAHAVTISDSALVVKPNGKVVVYVVIDGVAKARVVSVGIESGRRVQIKSGIAAGDRVVVRGNEKLKDGAKVRLLKGHKGAKKRQVESAGKRP